MSRKGRARRSKIPMSIRGGEGNPIAPRRRDSRPSAPTPQPREMVVATSAPPVGTPRPEAPPLSFETPAHLPANPPKPAETLEADAFSRDDVSVPPVGLDAAFFNEPLPADSSLELEPRDPHAARKLTPMAARRRAHLAKYVTLAVGLASALCAAALIKSTVARGHEDVRPRSAAVAQLAPAASPPPLDTATTTEPASSPPATAISAPADTVPPTAPAADSAAVPSAAPPSEPQAAPAASAAPEAPPAASAAPETPATSDVPMDPKEAAKEAAKQKVKARGALEWGKMPDAITAGEASVALDATDAEAWLILGAAYQQKGDAKNAVRCFKACIDQGKRGPKNECAAMLR
jgi:hypothetical protein